jgi:hypothetical protein
METVELIVKILGVIGFLLAIYNIWWDRRKFAILRNERLDDKAERQREKEQEAKAKEEQSRERVKADLYFGSVLNGGTEYKHEISLRLYNPCAFTVSIKYVFLTYNAQTNADGRKTTTAIHLFPKHFIESLTATFGLNAIDKDSIHGAEIATRKDIMFKTLPLEKSVIESIAQLSADDVYITINSPAGEIERIKGEEIVPGFKDLLKPPPSRTITT